MSAEEDPVDIGNHEDEYDNEDDEADSLREIIIEVLEVAIDAKELRREVLDMRSRLDVVVSASEALQTQMEVDRREQINSNEVLRGDVQALTEATNTLRDSIREQGAQAQDINARRWEIVKYVASGGLKLLSFTSDVFQVVSFIQSVIGGSSFLRSVERLRGEDDPVAKNRKLVTDWVNQDEDSFWKSHAAYHTTKTKWPLMSQLINAQLVLYLASGSQKLNPVYRWDAKEKMSIVQALEQTYLSQGGKAMYLSVPSLQHEGKPLPRVVALDCVSLALVLIIEKLKPSKKASMLRGPGDTGTEAMDRPAKHFEPVFVFQKATSPGLDIRDYARSITLAWNAKMLITQAVEPTHNLYIEGTAQDIVNDELIIEDADQVLSTIADVAIKGKAEHLKQQFLQMCSQTYPLLPGELIEKNHLALLMKPYRIAVPGSVAYVRVTNQAEMVFIAHQVRFDPLSGQPSLQYRSSLQLREFPSRRLKGETPDMSDADFFKKFIGPVAQTLAFALPQPLGVFASAGVQVLDEIFGFFGGSGDALVKVVEELLKETIDAIKELIIDDAIRKATDSMNIFLTWVSDLSTLKILQAPSSKDELWIKDRLNRLGNAGDPSFAGNILSDLGTLTDAQICTIYHDEVITLAFMAASCYFLSYRLRCQLLALLASFADNKHDYENYDFYAGGFYDLTIEFEGYLDTWSATLTQKLDGLVKDRLDCVKPVEYYDDRSTQCHTHGGPAGGSSCDSSGDDGYHCIDTFLGSDHEAVRIANNRWSSGCCNQNDHCESSWLAVVAKRIEYTNQLNQDLTAKYANHRQTVNEWKDGLAKVKAMMPPKQPAAPEIKAWLDQQPDPDLEGEGMQVQYLVEYTNAKGTSPISSGNEFVDVVAGKAPQLLIPTDPDGAATKRLIYRSLADPSGRPRERVKVDVLPDNTTQLWVDSKK